jgi:hypothetical protein
MNTTQADQLLKERGQSSLLADGLEQAFLGLGYQFNKPLAIYSKSKTLEALMAEGMDEEQAQEYFRYNIADAYVGESTPVFLEDDDDK